MEKRTELKYTQAAEERLERLSTELLAQVEGQLKEKEPIPGEGYIEVTASDIEDIARHIRIERPRLSERRSLIIYAYLTLGVITTLVGVYYRELGRLFIENPFQGALIVAGATMIVASLLLLRFTSIRE